MMPVSSCQVGISVLGHCYCVGDRIGRFSGIFQQVIEIWGASDIVLVKDCQLREMLSSMVGRCYVWSPAHSRGSEDIYLSFPTPRDCRICHCTIESIVSSLPTFWVSNVAIPLVVSTFFYISEKYTLHKRKWVDHSQEAFSFSPSLKECLKQTYPLLVLWL